jgi:hypothetical protein
MTKLVRLSNLPYDAVLLVRCSSGVSYQNQIGGASCSLGEIEGILAPIGLEPESIKKIARFDYATVNGVLPADVADAIDDVLLKSLVSSHIRVDRNRLDDSMEAWIHVVVSSPVSNDPERSRDYYGAVFGFGTVDGVLTWPNSD